MFIYNIVLIARCLNSLISIKLCKAMLKIIRSLIKYKLNGHIEYIFIHKYGIILIEGGKIEGKK